MRVRLHIENLVVEGIPVSTVPGLEASVRDELSLLILSRGLPGEARRDRCDERLAGPGIRVADRDEAELLGRRIAWSIYAALGGDPGRDV